MLLSTLLVICSASSAGMIAHFAEECPEGWVQYNNLNGRIVLVEDDETKIREIGGEKEVSLTENQNSPHDHALFSLSKIDLGHLSRSNYPS